MNPKEPSKPQTVPIIDVVIGLDGEPPGYQISLTEAECWGIGFVTVQWAHLEAVIATMTQQFCEMAQTPLPKDASNFSFARRLRAFRNVALELLTDNPARQSLLCQVPKIARLAGQRQRITHHLWEYNPESPETIWSNAVRDPKLRLEPFNVDKLHKLGRQIGQVTFALENPHLEGASSSEIFADTLQDRADDQGNVAFVSRSFLLALREKDPPNRDHPQESRPARTPPQSSSEE